MVLTNEVPHPLVTPIKFLLFRLTAWLNKLVVVEILIWVITLKKDASLSSNIWHDSIPWLSRWASYKGKKGISKSLKICISRQMRLQLNVCKQKHSKHRINVQTKHEHSSNWSQRWQCDNECLEDNSDSLSSFDIPEHSLDSKSSHKGNSWSYLRTTSLRSYFSNDRNYHNNEIKAIPLVFEVFFESKSNKFQNCF